MGRHLRDLPTVFGLDLIASIARAAEERTTWRSGNSGGALALVGTVGAISSLLFL